MKMNLLVSIGENLKKDLKSSEIPVAIVAPLFWSGLRSHQNTLICSFAIDS